MTATAPPWGDDTPTPPTKAKAKAKAKAKPEPTEPETPKIGKPALALLAEYEVTLEEALSEGLTGSGAKGNITKADVQAYLDQFDWGGEEDEAEPEQETAPDWGEEEAAPVVNAIPETAIVDDYDYGEVTPEDLIPEEITNPETLAKLNEWRQANDYVQQVKPWLEKERELRKEVAALLVDYPIEGTNYVPLPAGWSIKLTHKLSRKVDEAALSASLESLREAGLNPMALLEYKPSLRTKLYKGLTPEQRNEFDSILVISEASPTLELLPPPADDS